MRLHLQRLESVLLDGPWLAWALVFFAASAWAATAMLMSRGLVSLTGGQEAGLGVLAAAALAGVVAIARRYIQPIAAALCRLIEGNRQLLLAVLFGFVLRVLWIVIFDAQPASDGLTYLELAQKLITGQPYKMGGTHAYWPPGFAFFLGLFLLPLAPAVAIPVSQLVLFCVAVAGIYRLTLRLASNKAAVIAVCLFSAWPNLIAHSGSPEKETLVAALLIWALLSVTGQRPVSVFLAGALLGAATLVQPSTLLLIPAIGLVLLIRPTKRPALALAFLLFGAALVIAPWTVRNYAVLGQFKLVSTNGGSNLYRANNPLANGGYTPVGEVDLSHLSEMDEDRKAKLLAIEWIKTHPVPFLKLAAEKQTRLMGDDSGGIYATFRGNTGERSQSTYFALKSLANLWWLAVWAGIAALVIAGARLGKASFLVWGWAYIFVLHSVFESAGKYHVPMLWVPCILAGVMLADLGRTKSPDGQR